MDKRADWKIENPVPVDKNRNFALDILFRFLKTSFPSSPCSTYTAVCDAGYAMLVLVVFHYKKSLKTVSTGQHLG